MCGLASCGLILPDMFILNCHASIHILIFGISFVFEDGSWFSSSFDLDEDSLLAATSAMDHIFDFVGEDGLGVVGEVDETLSESLGNFNASDSIVVVLEEVLGAPETGLRKELTVSPCMAGW